VFRWFERRQVYHPSKTLGLKPADLNWPFDDISFGTADGVRLNGWFFPCLGPSRWSNWTVLICHGNAGNVSHRLKWYSILLDLGLNVFAFDYRGYGRSEGTPSEAGTYHDADAALDWLRQNRRPPRQVIALGESLGGAIAAELAIREPSLGGIILQSTFTSVADLGVELFPWLPVRWLNTIKYDTVAKLPLIQPPMMVMHSRGDRLIRFRHAERNYAAARSPKLFWEISGDHNEQPGFDSPQIRCGVEQFLRMLEAEPTPTTKP